MTVRRILRWSVPIDDKPHGIGGGDVVLVAKRDRIPGVHEVEVWTSELVGDDWPTGDMRGSRSVQIVGTGHPFPDDWVPLGSVLDGSFVWHVMET